MCQKLNSGEFIIKINNRETAQAIRNLHNSDKVSIKEPGPLKPKVKLKDIPTDYESDFI